MVVEETWAEQAACKGRDPDIFHPRINYRNTRRDLVTIAEAPAKAVCAECPVTAECLDYAERTRTEPGVWGGLGEGDRRRLRERQRRVS
jgi:WhiB family redox-sensing transcriptional regulator